MVCLDGELMERVPFPERGASGSDRKMFEGGRMRRDDEDCEERKGRSRMEKKGSIYVHTRWAGETIHVNDGDATSESVHSEPKSAAAVEVE